MLRDKLNKRTIFDILKIEPTLMFLLLFLAFIGLAVLYSASGQSVDMLLRQVIRLSFAFLVLLIVAQISPQYLKLISPWVYLAGIVMLLLVLLIGDVSKGAQRWLNLYFFKLQPSEWMKIAIPMILAWYVHNKQFPLKILHFLVTLILIVIPVVLIFKQPDLGTAILVASSGLFVIFLFGG
jgi:rod shape determining protein RodA